MAQPVVRDIARNHLLSTLSKDDLGLLQPSLEPVALPLRFVLEERNKPVAHVYFLTDGIASVVATGTKKREIEVGIIGREGMSGMDVVMGDGRSPHQTYMQVGGKGERMGADKLRSAIQKSPTLQRCLLRFAQGFMHQTAYTALANGQAKLEERLARWLLMAHDRSDGDELSLTHEFISVMLSVRRAGVTVALKLLESQGLIRQKRGLIIVEDRKGLVKYANGFYGVPETEYTRLIGWHGKANTK